MPYALEALRSGRTARDALLVTNDRDFGQLVFRDRARHEQADARSIIVLRPSPRLDPSYYQ